jgi:hypothetical protein
MAEGRSYAWMQWSYLFVAPGCSALATEVQRGAELGYISNHLSTRGR